MKTILRTLAFAAVCAAALTSCNKSDLNIADPVSKTADMVTINLVPAQSATKALLQDDYSFFWQEEDEKIAFFEEIKDLDEDYRYPIRTYVISDNYSLSEDKRKASFDIKLPDISDYLDSGYEDETTLENLILWADQEDGMSCSYAVVHPALSMDWFDAQNNEAFFSIPHSQKVAGEGTKVSPSNILIYGNLNGLEHRLGAAGTMEAEIAYQHICSYGRINFTAFPSAFNEADTTIDVYISFYDEDKARVAVTGSLCLNPFDGTITPDDDGYNYLQSKLNFWVLGDNSGNDDECWFTVKPYGNIVQMEVELSSEVLNGSWTKTVDIDKTFTPGKIKVWDLDFTTDDVEFDVY